MKSGNWNTFVCLRHLLLALITCAILSLTVGGASARPRKRSGSRIRRSHAAEKKKPSGIPGDESELAPVNAKPRLRLNDGTTIPVDDAWEDSQGVWYRKDGVTYLVERTRVRSIDRDRVANPVATDGLVAKAPGTPSMNSPSRITRTWIHLKGGARVEADEATESGAGVWLRRGSFSIFIERERVDRVEREEIASEIGTKARATPGWSTGNSNLDGLIKQNGAHYGVDPYLVFLVMEEESHFNPHVVSPKGARGLMQLMPGTSARFGVRHPFSPAENISGGVRYLKQLLQSHNGRVDLVLASYNAGEGAVAKFGQKVPPYRETRNYVRRISARYRKNEIAETVRRPDPQIGTN
ncbi:MAG: lytic transglycosylase domain-containing protein [Pyrinomonadaceae bacterium]